MPGTPAIVRTGTHYGPDVLLKDSAEAAEVLSEKLRPEVGLLCLAVVTTRAWTSPRLLKNSLSTTIRSAHGTCRTTSTCCSEQSKCSATVRPSKGLAPEQASSS